MIAAITLQDALGVTLLLLFLGLLAAVAVLGYLGLRRWTGASRRAARLTVAITVVVVAGGEMLAGAGPPRWAAYALSVLGVLLFCAACLVAGMVRLVGWRKARRELSRLLGCLLRLLWREREGADFAAARRAAGREGRVVQAGQMTVWTDSADELGPALEALAAEVGEQFARLTGSPATMRRTLRVLCFETEAAFAAYMRPLLPHPTRAVGFYSGIVRRRVTLCRELAERVPSQLKEAVAHELGHHLVRSSLRRQPPVWLDEGIPVALAARCGGQLRAAGGPLRWVRAARARGELLSGDQLVAVTRLELSQRGADWSDLGQMAFVMAFYAQSGHMVGFLRERDPDGFERFLAQLPSRRRHPQWFRECFGLAPDEAVALWLEQVEAAQLPTHEAPSEALQARIEAELVTPLRDPNTPPDDRRLAIRFLASTGYPWAADILLDILEGPDQPMATEARHALESIVGELHGTDPKAWRAWLAALPPHVVRQPRV